MKSLMEDPEISPRTQFIGIVRRANLEAEVLSLFTATVTLKNPSIVERYGILC
jgi:hypothetical protein